VIGKNWFETFIPERDKQEMLTVFQSFLNEDISFWEYENEIQCKDGTSCLIKWKNTLLRDSKNRPIGTTSQGTVLK
jgi:PAS domain S-box-containing protein